MAFFVDFGAEKVARQPSELPGLAFRVLKRHGEARLICEGSVALAASVLAWR